MLLQDFSDAVTLTLEGHFEQVGSLDFGIPSMAEKFDK